MGGTTETVSPETVTTPWQNQLWGTILQQMLPSLGQPVQAYPGQMGPSANPLAPAALGMISNYLGIPTQQGQAGMGLSPLEIPTAPAMPEAPVKSEYVPEEGWTTDAPENLWQINEETGEVTLVSPGTVPPIQYQQTDEGGVPIGPQAYWGEQPPEEGGLTPKQEQYRRLARLL